MKLAEYGVWRAVDPSKLLMPTLEPEETKAYTKLVDSGIPKVPLSSSRDVDWLFALWGNGNLLSHAYPFAFSFLLCSAFCCVQFNVYIFLSLLLYSCLSNAVVFFWCSVKQGRDR